MQDTPLHANASEGSRARQVFVRCISHPPPGTQLWITEPRVAPSCRVMSGRLLLAMFLGGAAGGLGRAALEHAWPTNGRSWPWVTFAVNIAGTALLAYVVTRLSHRTYARSLLGIGLCGALTTFSTLQLEALELADNDHALLGATYALTSIGAGLLVAYAVSRRLVGPGPKWARGEPAS